MILAKNGSREGGFTMVELIAVMIVIAIMSAYAIPKFMNLTEDAKTSAARAAVASGVSMAQHEVMAYMLRNAGDVPAAKDLTGLAKSHDLGDYVVGYKVAGDDITVYACEDGTTNCNASTAIVGRDKDGKEEPVSKELTISELAGQDTTNASGGGNSGN
ncbi:type II secretion system protein [Halodesulfovibrio sp.]|jgi:prepilin-type N-terminal cleavage/methylation domain-containing protein|uniref:type II secretion system protein n=1 Tax=Halodesulfovibrio sp. TaxID=1912772 RepID=UPI0025E27943|nr:type II secretion system protein [Halodesulfovibrio sp.]MCT4534803.1 type II secretion system GspH family protein [Halodesulfovibrio sp.]